MDLLHQSVWLAVQAKCFMKYFPRAAYTTGHFNILDSVSWKSLAPRYSIAYNILSFWPHSWAKEPTCFQLPQFIYCHLLSETFPHREGRLRAGAGKCVTLHKYNTATPSLNNAWVTSIIIQHRDQLRVTFITVYAEEALATSQLKLFLHLISCDTVDTSHLPLLQTPGLGASAPSVLLSAPTASCTGGACSCVSLRTMAGSR